MSRILDPAGYADLMVFAGVMGCLWVLAPQQSPVQATARGTGHSQLYVVPPSLDEKAVDSAPVAGGVIPARQEGSHGYGHSLQMAVDETLSAGERALAIDRARRQGHTTADHWDVWSRFLPSHKRKAVVRAVEAYEAARILSSSQWPVRGQSPVSSEFGKRLHPIDGGLRMHHGIDIAVPTGTPVLATAPGRVINLAHGAGSGLAIVLDHGHGLTTRYCHLSATLVSTHASIDRGQEIGLSGNSGRSTGPHLHFEARWHDKSVDPRRFLPNSRGRAATVLNRP